MPTDIQGLILEPTQEFSHVWAYNHNYYTFSSVIASDGDFATITYEDVSLTLYPDLNGLFTFDTYEFSRELFNYKDAFTYDANFADSNQYRLIDFNIEITKLDETVENQTLEVSFYNGAVQRWDTPNALEYNDPIPTPIYFEGYPFDYSVVTGTGVIRTLPTDLSVLNVVDDNCNGVYIKYHNGKAGYEYYLFNQYAKGNYSTSSLGSVKEQFSWTNNMFEIGKTGQRQTLAYAKIPYEYREMMYNLADSNEVYIYTGNRGDIDFVKVPEGIGIDVIGIAPIGFDGTTGEVIDIHSQWLEVEINMKVQESNFEASFEQNITILLPESQTRTRI